MSQEQLEALLGRPLTPFESANFDTYLNIATERLNDLLCFDISVNSESGETEATEKIYMPRLGYKSLFTDPFISIDAIEVGDKTLETGDYTIKQYERYSATWYNTIVLDDVMDSDDLITVTAVWGLPSLPPEIGLLLARMFGVHSSEAVDRSVKSKSIEGFSVTYNDKNSYDDYLLTNASTISKYRYCHEGEIQHGSVGRIYHDRIY